MITDNTFVYYFSIKFSFERRRGGGGGGGGGE